MRLFVIRHGKPKVLVNDFYQAHLSDEGLRQAKQLARSGNLTRPDVIFSSPYNRAIDTAKALCEVFEIDFEVKAFLKEWNLQSLNLLDPEYAFETQKGWTDHRVQVQGGESLDDVQKRIYEGTMQITSTITAETIYFVSHGTLMEMLCAKVSGRQAVQHNVEKIKFLDYAAFEFEDGRLKLTRDVITL